MIVIGQVLADPWLSISLNGQFPTWIPVAEGLGLQVRHSHGRRPGRALQSADRTHEWLRWHGAGRTVIPRLDSWAGKRFLNNIPTASVTEFCGTGGVAWAQDLHDVYALQRWKILGSLTQALKEEFDLVYFTTASSYVRPDRLLQVIESLPRTGLYAGTPHVDAGTGIRFASGANRILSRDVVELVVSNRLDYRNDVMEDVGLGNLIIRAGIPLVELPSINVGSFEVLRSLGESDIERNFHFRMTSGTRRERLDTELMAALHQRILSIDVGPQDPRA